MGVMNWPAWHDPTHPQSQLSLVSAIAWSCPVHSHSRLVKISKCDSLAWHALHSSLAPALATKLRLASSCQVNPTPVCIGVATLPGLTNTQTLITCSSAGATALQESSFSYLTKSTSRPRFFIKFLQNGIVSYLFW